MAVGREHPRRGLGDVVEIDEAQPRLDRIGNAEHAVRDDAAPGAEDVLHVGGRLQDGELEAGGEQHLLDPHLLPVMRHRLDLRMQHRVINEALHVLRLRRVDDGAREREFVGADIRADVIDRLRSGGGERERAAILEAADADLGGAERLERVDCSVRRTSARTLAPFAGQRLDDRLCRSCRRRR